MSLSLLFFKEWVREKIFISFLIILFAATVLGYLLSQLVVNEQQRMVADFGLFLCQFVILIFNLIYSSQIIHREQDKRTLYLILSKPISRFQLFWGIMGGLALINFVLLLTSIFWLSFFIDFQNLLFKINFVLSFFIFFLKVTSLSFFVFAISLISRSSLAFVFGLGYWFLAHSKNELFQFMSKIDPALSQNIEMLFKFLVPEFYRLNWHSYSFLQTLILPNQIVWAIFHCLIWLGVFLVLNSFILKRKDFV